MKKLIPALMLMASMPSWADVCEPSSVWLPSIGSQAALTFINWNFTWTGTGNPPPGLMSPGGETRGCGVATGKPPRTEGASGLESQATQDRYTARILQVAMDPSPAQSFTYEMAFWSLSFDDIQGNAGWLRLYLLPERNSVLVEKRIQFASGKEETSRVRMQYQVQPGAQVCAEIEVQRVAPAAPLSLSPGGDWKVTMRCTATGASDSVTTSFGNMAKRLVMVGRLSDALPIGEFSFSFGEQ